MQKKLAVMRFRTCTSLAFELPPGACRVWGNGVPASRFEILTAKRWQVFVHVLLPFSRALHLAHCIPRRYGEGGGTYILSRIRPFAAQRRRPPFSHPHFRQIPPKLSLIPPPPLAHSAGPLREKIERHPTMQQCLFSHNFDPLPLLTRAL